MQSLEVHVAVHWQSNQILDPADSRIDVLLRDGILRGNGRQFYRVPSDVGKCNLNPSLCLQPSPWSISSGKRWFDVLTVILSLPLVIPILLLVALAVRLSSRGPVLFVQTRVGQYGRLFRIFKFRTMTHNSGENRPLVTTLGNQPFTPVGPFLRKWKLDELLQVMNVLRGEMSLVGPRPKVPNHEYDLPLCRPGITGAATLVFAREEALLDPVPGHLLDDYVHQVVLPAKRQMDADYMSRATLSSDLAILLKSVFRRWSYCAAGLYPSLAEADSNDGRWGSDVLALGSRHSRRNRAGRRLIAGPEPFSSNQL